MVRHGAWAGSTNAVIHLHRHGAAAPASAIGLDDFDAASRQVPVIANIRPSGDKYLMEDFYYAGGLPALMSRLGTSSTSTQITVTGGTWARASRAPGSTTTTSSARSTSRSTPRARWRCCSGNLAPDGCVIKPSRLRAAPAEAHRPGAGLRRLSGDLKAAIDRPDLDVTPDHVLVLQERRSAGRPRHAGMGHAADPEQAAEAGRARHDAHLRRAHVRHQLRRLHSACGAGVLCRRAAGAGRERRHDHGRRARALASRCTCRTRSCPPPRRLAAAASRATSAATAGCSRATSRQANKGCDFDFLETGFGKPVGEPSIY